ncbi:MAG: hypothetical protein GX348_10975 [Veillonellaceae bacterium]|jgi:hypothetical protein|nr:hypothetical protein [Veillonellaceae bacterium]
MRLRRKHIRKLKRVSNENVNSTSEFLTETNGEEIKIAKPVVSSNMGFIRKIVNNPNFTFQVLVIILTLASDNVRMDRRIDTMTTKIEAIRGITDVLTNTMQSVRAASEAPKHIRKLLQ